MLSLLDDLRRQEPRADELLGDRGGTAAVAAAGELAARSALTVASRSKPGFSQKVSSSTAVVTSRMSGGISSNLTTSRRCSQKRASSVLPVRS